MTTLSQYLKAERPDVTEPVSFYVPGIASWQEFRTSQARYRAAMALRSAAEGERLYAVEQDNEEDES